MSLDIVGGRGRGRAGLVGKVGVTSLHRFLCGLWSGRIYRTSMNAGGIQRPERFFNRV